MAAADADTVLAALAIDRRKAGTGVRGDVADVKDRVEGVPFVNLVPAILCRAPPKPPTPPPAPPVPEGEEGADAEPVYVCDLLCRDEAKGRHGTCMPNKMCRCDAGWGGPLCNVKAAGGSKSRRAPAGGKGGKGGMGSMGRMGRMGARGAPMLPPRGRELPGGQGNVVNAVEAKKELARTDWPSWWPSPHLRWLEVGHPRAAILSIAGWPDRSTVTSALRRHHNMGNDASWGRREGSNHLHVVSIVPGTRDEAAWQPFYRESVTCFFLLRLAGAAGSGPESRKHGVRLPGGQGGGRFCRPLPPVGVDRLVNLGVFVHRDAHEEASEENPATMAREYNSQEEAEGSSSGGGGSSGSSRSVGGGGRSGPGSTSWYQVPVDMMDDTFFTMKGRTQLEMQVDGSLTRSTIRIPGIPQLPPDMSKLTPRVTLSRRLGLFPEDQLHPTRRDCYEGVDVDYGLWPRTSPPWAQGLLWGVDMVARAGHWLGVSSLLGLQGTTVTTATNAGGGAGGTEEREPSVMLMVSEPLSQPLHLVGHGTVRLYLTINAPEDAPMAAPTKDVLIHAIISDVETAAGGLSQTQTKTKIVSDGQLRGIGRKAGVQHMPYRDVTAWRSFRERDAVPVRTNKMFVADVSLAPTAHTFLPGHRVGLSVQVSSFHTDQPGWRYSVHVGGLGGSYVEFPGEPILDPDDPRARQGNVRRENRDRRAESTARSRGEEEEEEAESTCT